MDDQLRRRSVGAPAARSLLLTILGEYVLPRGEPVCDDSFVLLFNAHAEDRTFKLPRRRMGERWELELCTADPEASAGSVSYSAQEQVNVTAHSITILRRVA